MTIDTSKPLEVVADWNPSLVWRAEYSGFKEGELKIVVLEDHYTDECEAQSDTSWPSGTDWHFNTSGVSTGSSIELTLRNVKEPSELTWETCPQWARDKAAHDFGFENFGEVFCGFNGENMRQGFQAAALRIAKHETPPELVDPALEIAREICAAEAEKDCRKPSYIKNILNGGNDASRAVRAAQVAYERGHADALKDQTP